MQPRPVDPVELGVEARAERPFCSFYLPKLMLVLVYIGVSATLFLVHGRVPDRINVAEAQDIKDPRQLGLIVGLTGSLVGVGCLAHHTCSNR